MKKIMKLTAVLSTAALMTAIAPGIAGVTGFGVAQVMAQPMGWVQEDEQWVFYDNDGYLVTDSWRRENDKMYYLDEEGKIAFNQKVDDYYVGADGSMVTNTWISISNTEDLDSPDAPEGYSYYFGKTGKAAVSQWLSLDNKWYYFNEDGHMQTGLIEVDGATYYCGEQNDGSMKTGWIKLEDQTGSPEINASWYYFDQNGKMIEDQIDKKINDKYYTFTDGKMQTGWVKTGTATTSNADGSTSDLLIENYQYYGQENDGVRASGWLNVEGVPGISNTDETHRFYFKNGKPYAAESGIQLFTIDSKKYAFNEKGEMQTGLKVVNLGNDQVAHFFFNADDGVMKTGKQNIYNDDLGENQTWFFYTDGEKKGQGFHGIRDNSVYVYGLRQDASSDLRYGSAELNGVNYLVNASGSIQKASSSSKSSANPDLGAGYKDYKDSNGKTWIVDVSGIIQ